MLKYSVLSRIPENVVLATPVFQTDDAPVFPARAGDFPSHFLRSARSDGFRGKAGETHVLQAGQPAARLLLVGLGRRGEADLQSLRLAAAAAVRRADDAGLAKLAFFLPVQFGASEEEARAVVEGAGLAAYRFEKHKSKPRPPLALSDFILIIPGAAGEAHRAALRTGAAAVRAVDFARDLINEPPSRKTPETLGRAALALGGKGVRVKVFRKADLVRMKADALLGVNRGSAHPPVMIHLHYRPAGKPRRRIALVGKGITFDSGGLSLKTAEGMMTMKYDMAGAASVLGIFSILAELKPSVEVHGIAPVTENLPGPDAYKPGDVVRAMNGKTIEVLNTDAEGRIVLADALSYTAKLSVDEIVDVATLTGAAAIALGKSIAAVMANDDGVYERLRKASAAAGEKIWRLPLEREYKDHIKSKVADLKNIGNPGEAGTIIGGLFLEEFTGGKKWAHVDMASVGWNGAGSLLSPAGATGAPVRTLLNYLLG